jgi:hypothetical protein
MLSTGGGKLIPVTRQRVPIGAGWPYLSKNEPVQLVSRLRPDVEALRLAAVPPEMRDRSASGLEAGCPSMLKSSPDCSSAVDVRIVIAPPASRVSACVANGASARVAASG